MTTTYERPVRPISPWREPTWDVDEVAREFREQGYSIIRGFFTAEESEAMLRQMKAAAEQTTELGANSDGEMHFLNNVYYDNVVLQSILSQQKVVDVLKPISTADFRIRWDQAVLKGPGSPRFPWHQDNGYNLLLVEHQQFWVALTPMTAETGGLWVIPGSHKRGLLPHRKVGHQLEAITDTSDGVLIEAQPGDVVLFSSLLLHYTGPNVTEDFERWAYVVEYLASDLLDPYKKGPYFRVATNGKSSPGFTRFHKGQFDPRQHSKYLGSYLRRIGRKLRKRGREAITPR